MNDSLNMLETGNFIVGCNYWASHAGASMWSNWRADVVEKDFEQMSAAGLQVVRVFPLWPDFQPLTQLYGAKGKPKELSFGNEPLPDTEAGKAGVSEKNMRRFRKLADIAHKNNIKISVALITGWMSGRNYAPSAFERLNALTDPLAIMWEVKFVRYFVRTFKNHPAIIAWSPGNECNCLAEITSRQQAWNWMNAICSAIKLEDPEKPVLSGMHSLRPKGKDMFGKDGLWTIDDQAELSDMLTTHPYPKFTPYCAQDPINEIRNVFHATVESCFYADIGQKPCIAEEVGTLNPMVCNENIKADYIRNTLFNLWTHDCHGLIWWCAYDQDKLKYPPYDWDAHERELGLMKSDRTPKPVIKEIERFRRNISKMPFKSLPERKIDAVCILSEGQDAWANAYSSFILAKQAGFDIKFQASYQAIRDASCYIVPGVCGSSSFTGEKWRKLQEKVKKGATLYVSLDNCFLAPFEEMFGSESLFRQENEHVVEFKIDGESLSCASSVKLGLSLRKAKAVAKDKEGIPVYTKFSLGKGAVYLLTVPIEKYLSRSSGMFHKKNSPQFWKIYNVFANEIISKRTAALIECSKKVTITEHELSDSAVVIVIINNSSEETVANIKISDGWEIDRTLYGNLHKKGKCHLKNNDALAFVLKKT